MSPAFKGIHPCSDRSSISLDAENSGAGTVHEDLAQLCVTAFADTQQACLAFGGVLPGNKPKPGGKLTAIAVGGSVADGRDNGRGYNRPDPWNLLYGCSRHRHQRCVPAHD
jgi:hypothetical protein